ncbi:MAG: hypothetical protein KGI93_09860 [Acidobacteriota bacterium]|nr:hypothetical protein [Acidobacteriota bacterium]
MYDALTGRYTFACPARGETHVPLSSFRRIERLGGTAHPVVFRVRFACPCGDEHDGLVSHDDLDWAPLGLGAADDFVNLMTSRVEPISAELGDLAATRIGAGEWPWSFFCYPEELPRPAFPSSFSLLSAGDGTVGLAVRCPHCRRLSLNLVSQPHVDVPFHNDREVGVVEHLFPEDALETLEGFRAELWSSAFDARRLTLE